MRGFSKKKWLWSAVTSRPLESSSDITGFTSSSNSTKSPIITSLPPVPLDGEPATESKWRWRCNPIYRHLEVPARDIHFEDTALKVSLLSQCFQNFGIVSRCVLRRSHCHGGEHQ